MPYKLRNAIKDCYKTLRYEDRFRRSLNSASFSFSLRSNFYEDKVSNFHAKMQIYFHFSLLSKDMRLLSKGTRLLSKGTRLLSNRASIKQQKRNPVWSSFYLTFLRSSRCSCFGKRSTIGASDYRRASSEPVNVIVMVLDFQPSSYLH